MAKKEGGRKREKEKKTQKKRRFRDEEACERDTTGDRFFGCLFLDE